MATFFKIGTTDISSYVASLQIGYGTAYNAQINAAGDTVVDVVNNKRTFNITTRHLTDAEMSTLTTLLANLKVVISYRDVKTKALVMGVNCIVSTPPEPEYYTIGTSVFYKPIKLTFQEL